MMESSIWDMNISGGLARSNNKRALATARMPP